MLMVILEPDMVRGLAYLIMERENKPDIMFAYIPAIRRARKVEGAIDRYAPFSTPMLLALI